MADLNIYAPLGDLQTVPIYPGGLCSITYFKREDVAVWPTIDPSTGALKDTIQLHPGGTFYAIAATEKDRTFSEDEKSAPEGPYYEQKVSAHMAGNSAAHVLVLGTASFHQFGVIATDRDGMQRLLGNEDSGCILSKSFTSSDLDGSRSWQLNFSWQHPGPAPIYKAKAFTISTGGGAYSIGTLTLVARFQVGAPGAPMMDGGTTFTSSQLMGKNALVVADGVILSVDDGSGAINWASFIGRYVKKTLNQSQVTFVGGVAKNEIIEIYAYL